MKKLIWHLPLSASFQCVLTYAWLFIANSGSPSPGKELILLLYVLLIAILFLRLKSLKEIVLFAVISGLINGGLGLAIVMTFFPGAFHDVDIQTERASIILTGAVMLAAFYLMAGLLMHFFRRLVRLNTKP